MAVISLYYIRYGKKSEGKIKFLKTKKKNFRKQNKNWKIYTIKDIHKIWSDNDLFPNFEIIEFIIYLYKFYLIEDKKILNWLKKKKKDSFPVLNFIEQYIFICLNFLYKIIHTIHMSLTIVFILVIIFTMFWPLYFLVFFRCLILERMKMFTVHS